jgi:hypothetical protein
LRPADCVVRARLITGGLVRFRDFLHSDMLTSSATNVAARGAIAVYPVSGWWKELSLSDRSGVGAHYALIVSIEIDAIGADIGTEFANQIGIAFETNS